jgi:hypothetical protein
MLKEINTGKVEYARESFELYQYGINTQGLLGRLQRKRP